MEEIINKIINVRKIFDDFYKNELQNCSQEGIYHVEGDVYTHTMMVLKEAIEDYNIDNNVKKLFILSALLHDVAKPLAKFYNIEKNKIYFTGHGNIGVFYGYNFLMKVKKILKLSYEDIIKILYIVNYHDAHWLYKEKFKEMFKYDEELYFLLKTFNKYDINGRITTPNNKIAKFPEVKFEKYNNKLEFDKKVIFLIGAPASGKDTYLYNNNISTNAIVSRDTILEEYGRAKYGYILTYNEIWKKLTNEDQKEIDKILMNDFKLKLEHNDLIYVNMTNMSFKSRRRFISQFPKKYNVAVDFYVFLVDYKELIKRNNNREGKNISEDVILNMCKKFTLPLKFEYTNIHNIKFIFQ